MRGPPPATYTDDESDGEPVEVSHILAAMTDVGTAHHPLDEPSYLSEPSYISEPSYHSMNVPPGANLPANISLLSNGPIVRAIDRPHERTFDLSIIHDRAGGEPGGIAVHDRVTELLPDAPISYEIITGGTVKGGDLLTDTAGYSYAVKKKFVKSTTWACSNRGCDKCPAVIKQVGETFTPGTREHTHAGDPDKAVRAKARAHVRIIP